MTTFIALDDKSECFAYYSEGRLVYEPDLPPTLTRTWKYLPFLESENVEYAFLYAGAEIDDICPEFLRPRWDKVKNKHTAFLRSFSEAKVSLEDNCFYELVPEQFLLEYFDTQCKIADYVFDNFEKPNDYSHRVELHKMLYQISLQSVKLDRKPLLGYLHNTQARQFSEKINNWKHISFNQFGTKTGRLTTKQDSFPILTMNKDFRSCLKPQNHFFVEFDYNAAEPRVFLALAGWEQPTGDIHQWNAEKLYNGEKSRSEAKSDFLAWFYNPSDTRDFGQFYNRQEVLDKFWNGCYITNPFGRKIDADHHHALNYLIQSTTTDLVQRQAVKVFNFLNDKKSTLAFTMHDSIIVDLHVEDKELIKIISRMFGDTKFGKFKVVVAAGQDFGNLEELDI